MSGSLKLFTWFGIPVFLHWSFGLIFLYISWVGYSGGQGMEEIAWKMGLALALFGCVLLHEYGHALAARRYGVGTHDIILTPIGGMARLERMPEKPIQEFIVAIAGPLVNFVIAILLFALCFFFFKEELLAFFNPDALRTIEDKETGDIIDQIPFENTLPLKSLFSLMILNIVLAVFNLIPAFPMDGGRIFRALLSMRIGRPRATRIAAGVGQAIALLLAGYGLWSNDFFLAILGIFVIYTARLENSTVQLEHALGRFKARDAMRPNYTKLNQGDWMQSAVELIRTGLERHFLVFDMSGRLMGTLEESAILDSIRRSKLSESIGQHIERPQVAHVDDNLIHIHNLLRQKNCGIVAIADNEDILGVIDDAGLHYFLKTQGI
jgi:Zn-dependent protease